MLLRRSLLALAVAALLPASLAAQPTPCARPGAVRPGLEVLLADSVHLVRGKRVGIVTNHTGLDRCGRRNVDLLVATPEVRVVALFAPEHGLSGTAAGGAVIRSGRDSATGVPVHSLYGERLAPTAAMLRDVDVLLYDVQDVGARPYTFVWTMALAAREAGKAGKPLLVLDRPNPIRADRVEGGLIEPAWRTITGLHPVPLRYGLTPGELARWLVGERRVTADVRVVPMSGYRRSMWLDETGVPWVAPSPNIRDLETALLYPGLVFFEATSASEGRGTTRPLRAVGASWLADAAGAARELNALALPGVRFSAARRAVRAGQEFGGRTIPMIDVDVTDRDAIEAVAVGAHLLRVVRRRHPAELRFQARGLEELAGDRRLRSAIIAPSDSSLRALLDAWRGEAAAWREGAEKYWLYPE